MNIETKRVEVKVERECQCVSEADMFIVDRYETDGREHMLIWDVGEANEFAIGFNFHGYSDEDDYGWHDMLFDKIDVIPDKRTAMQAWLNLTRED